MHREGGITLTREGRRGFHASVVVRFYFGEWRIVFDRVDARLCIRARMKVCRG